MDNGLLLFFYVNFSWNHCHMPDKHKNLNSPLLAIIIVVVVLLITLDLFLKSGGDFAREVVRGEGIPAPPSTPPSPPYLHA